MPGPAARRLASATAVAASITSPSRSGSAAARRCTSASAILVVAENLEALLQLCDRHVVIERGRVVWTGTSDEPRRDRSVVDRHLRV